MTTWPEIVAKVQQRRDSQSLLIDQMIQVRDRYNGDFVVPMANTDDETPMPPLMPAIIANAIDTTALRAASMMPSIYCPALDASRDKGVRSREYAAIRKRALGYTWNRSQWELASRRAFRQLSAYATAAFVVVPDMEREFTRIELRDALTAYPEPRAAEDLTPINDCAFVYSRSAEWLKSTYPQTTGLIGSGGYGRDLWDLVEWEDEDSCVIGVLGPSVTWRSSWSDPVQPSMELSRYPNRTGRCRAYVPRRVTLDRIASQVANMVGLADMMAKLVALDIRATEKAIYPDKYLIAKQGQSPQLVGGTWQPGYTGNINMIIDADAVGQLHGTPDPHNSQTIDRLERNANVSMGVAPQQLGETYGALRTGRGIDASLAAAVDPRIQELHEIMQIAMREVNEIVIDTYKGYWPDKQYTVYSGWTSDKGHVEFTPRKHFETCNNSVEYPIPGADVQGTTVIVGQAIGMNLMSTATGRRMHPYIGDADEEERQILLEHIDQALNTSFLTRAAQGGIPPADAARVRQLVGEGKSMADALIAADEEAKAKQASAPPTPEGMASAPEAMPGLGNVGEGEAQPSIPQGPGGLANFRDLVSNLRATSAAR